ncbi:MAG: DUF4188 domain-containing protein [Thermomicrobiales bacterium]
MSSMIQPRQSIQVPKDGVVLFLVGMRINQVWNVRQWMPVIAAMTGMLNELARHPELGVLGPSRTYRSGRTLQVQQYWRSLEDLESYARSKEHAHLPAWREFYRRARGNKAVGIYHETYAVPPHGGDALYVNMPVHGLGTVAGSVPAAAREVASNLLDPV